MAVCAPSPSLTMLPSDQQSHYCFLSPCGASCPATIIPPSLESLFPPSPNLPPKPVSPRIRFVGTGTKYLPPLSRLSSATSVHADSEPHGQNGQGASSSVVQHASVVHIDSESGENKRKEVGWTLDKVKQSARSRLRPITCLWKDEHDTRAGCPSDPHAPHPFACDAVLASYTLLRKVNWRVSPSRSKRCERTKG